MPVSCTSLPLAGVPIYSPWWVARLLQRATTLSPRLLCPQWCLPHPGSLCGKMCYLVLGSLGLIGSEEFLCCVEVTCMVPELLLFPTHQGLVLLCRHFRLLPIRFPR